MSIFLRRAFGFTALADRRLCSRAAGAGPNRKPAEPATERASAAPPSGRAGSMWGMMRSPSIPRSSSAGSAIGSRGVRRSRCRPPAPRRRYSARCRCPRAPTWTRPPAMVTVRDIAVGSGSFPTAGERAGAYLDAVRRHLATLTWQVTRARLQADLAIDQAAGRGQSQPLRNDPPRIVYVQSPTILVPIDGEPVLREIAGLGPAAGGEHSCADSPGQARQPLLPLRGRLLARGRRRWKAAGRKRRCGPWRWTKPSRRRWRRAPSICWRTTRRRARGVPKVIVSTGPTELVQTDGPPQYAPIGRTDLLFVTNSPNRLFLDLRTQTHYVLLAGRWYRTSSLARGPWDYVAGADLPADFALIPDDHPTASVRAAVPGTAEAQESVIANSVPQIATVKRSAARLEITYDGAPEFRPIQGTALEAAANAPVPVIRVDGRTYYALDNGVWFFSELGGGTVDRGHLGAAGDLHDSTQPSSALRDLRARVRRDGRRRLRRLHPRLCRVVRHDREHGGLRNRLVLPPVDRHCLVRAAGDLGLRLQLLLFLVESVACASVVARLAAGAVLPSGVGTRGRIDHVGREDLRCGGRRRPAGRANHGHGAVVVGGRNPRSQRVSRESRERGRHLPPLGPAQCFEPPLRRAQPDARPGVRATDRSAAFRPPMSRQRDERGPPLDRNQWFGESQRPQAGRAALGQARGPSRSIQPAGSSGRAARRGIHRAARCGRQAASPPARRPPQTCRARPVCGTAIVPRRVTPAPVRRRAARFDGRSERAHLDAPRRCRTASGAGFQIEHAAERPTAAAWSRGAQIPGPDGAREFRAPPRRQDAQRDWGGAPRRAAQ